MRRKGSVSRSGGAAGAMGSSRATGRPRWERTNRSPLATRRRTDCASFLNSSIVTLFIMLKFNLKLKLLQAATADTTGRGATYGPECCGIRRKESLNNKFQQHESGCRSEGTEHPKRRDQAALPW